MRMLPSLFAVALLSACTALNSVAPAIQPSPAALAAVAADVAAEAKLDTQVPLHLEGDEAMKALFAMRLKAFGYRIVEASGSDAKTIKYAVAPLGADVLVTLVLAEQTLARLYHVIGAGALEPASTLSARS